MKDSKPQKNSARALADKSAKAAPEKAERGFIEQVLDSWRVHNDINLLLIGAISDKGFAAVPPGSRGRDLARQLMHMHNVRVQWLQSSAKAETRGLTIYGREEELTREQMQDALRQSGAAVETFLRCLLKEGNSRFFGGGPLRSMSYLISHESHHRGQIALTLKLNGVRLPDKVAMQGL
jgi:uncharacterized damage-inducible protein DinB